jgi:hypothetical protein
MHLLKLLFVIDLQNDGYLEKSNEATYLGEHVYKLIWLSMVDNNLRHDFPQND